MGAEPLPKAPERLLTHVAEDRVIEIARHHIAVGGEVGIAGAAGAADAPVAADPGGEDDARIAGVGVPALGGGGRRGGRQKSLRGQVLAVGEQHHGTEAFVHAGNEGGQIGPQQRFAPHQIKNRNAELLGVVDQAADLLEAQQRPTRILHPP